MTYKEIINRFRTITDNHLMLQDFGYGDLSDLKYVSQLGTEEERVSYPYLYLLPSSSNRNGPVMNYSFNMIIMDMARPEDGADTDAYDNYITIQSQCQQYIDDVLAQLYYFYKDQPEIALTGITYTPFKEKYQDVVAGMTATISIAVPTPLNECIAPFDNRLLFLDVNSTTSAPLGGGNGYIYAENVVTDTYGAWNWYGASEIWLSQTTVLDVNLDIIIEGSFTIQVNEGANQTEWDAFYSWLLGVNTSTYSSAPGGPPPSDPVLLLLADHLPATVPAVGTRIKIPFYGNIGPVTPANPSSTTQWFGVMLRNQTPPGGWAPIDWLTQEASTIQVYQNIVKQ